jgi:hypothetical protein
MAESEPNEPATEGELVFESAGPATGEDLQFEHAEYAEVAPSAPTCGVCKQAIPHAYFAVNHLILCPQCRGRVEQSLRGGSGLARFVRAAVFGSVAGVAGFAIYFGVMKLANMEIGLISILVGYMVGAAVRKGSQGRGGWLYQLLAIFLTYTAIAASYSAVALPQFLTEMRAKKAETAAATPEAPGGAEHAAEAGNRPLGRVPPIVALTIVLFVVLAFCYAIPILVGIQSPISLLIVAFALWEAWKLNKRMRIQFLGPFQVGSGPAAGPLEAPAHG